MGDWERIRNEQRKQFFVCLDIMVEVVQNQAVIVQNHTKVNKRWAEVSIDFSLESFILKMCRWWKCKTLGGCEQPLRIPCELQSKKRANKRFKNPSECAEAIELSGPLP